MKILPRKFNFFLAFTSSGVFKMGIKDFNKFSLYMLYGRPKKNQKGVIESKMATEWLY